MPFASRLGAFAAAALVALPAIAQEGAPAENPLAKIPWQPGPTVGKLGDRAEIDVPEGMLFTGGEGTKTFLELTQNFPTGAELGMLFHPPADESDAGWFVLFTFDDAGYVKDDEKNDLDAKAILENIREGTNRANDERVKRGWSTLEIVDWEKAPYYDETTHNLTWAVRTRSEGQDGVNWSTRLLGRRGYMNVELVLGAEDGPKVLPSFRSALENFRYTSGESYAEFRKGDKIAKVGLAALIAGGAGAVALKTGLLQKFWKLIVVGIAALGGLVKKFWSRFRGETTIAKPEEPTA